MSALFFAATGQGISALLAWRVIDRELPHAGFPRHLTADHTAGATCATGERSTPPGCGPTASGNRYETASPPAAGAAPEAHSFSRASISACNRISSAASSCSAKALRASKSGNDTGILPPGRIGMILCSIFYPRAALVRALRPTIRHGASSFKK